jgi:hypothetical protein
MKLVEFFSVSTKVEEEILVDEEMQKEVMAFILDNDQIYKQDLFPIIEKMRKGKDVTKDLSEMVKKSCLEFYKEKEFKKDPNKLFPKKMRENIINNLHKIASENYIK